MSKLKLAPVLDDKPVKVTVEFPAAVYRDLIAYAEALGSEAGRSTEPAKIIAPMVARFMATDRTFARIRKAAQRSNIIGRRDRPSADKSSDLRD